ncbi:hypothetical protein J437_LFUL013827, partial [Ladona fulva]
MILHKWNEALIDWVNCLSLTGRISDIEELKNGEFFRFLLKKLTASEVIIECASDSFDDIYNVLEKEFPLYGVREIGRDDSRLSYIASLLLLLSVTKEETPMFQSNLCEDLSHDSQVKIKCFLESCLESTNELNHSYLKTVIEGDAVSYDQTSAKVKDNVSIKTPMKDFFDSPRQTNKLKRDLKRIEAENETLLLDKLELEDELRIEKEKRQRIEDALSRKTEQVLKLREELQDFIQNSNSKADEDDISSQSVSAIKSELRELETYVSALQEEKTTLFEEKEKLQEKITTLQSKSKDLELQTVYSATKQQELLAMLHKRDEEVSSLKEHCAELEEKINALPSALNMSIESDTSLPLGTISSPFGGERLSHAVVDVKLAEVEEENKKIKDQVKLLIDERDILMNQLKELHETLAKEKEEVKSSRLKIESLMIDLQAIKDSNSFKEKSLLEFEIKLSEKEILIQNLEKTREVVITEKKLLESNILSLNNNIKLLEETKGEILRNNSDYKIQLLELSGKLSALDMHLESKEKNLLNLREELAGKNILTENMRQEMQKCKEEIEIMKEKSDSMEETISLKDKECEELMKKISSKDDMIEKFENDVRAKEKFIEELGEKLREKTNLIHSLESAHESLEAEKKQLESELEHINCQIIEKDSVAEKANQEIIEYRDKLEKTIEELKDAKDSCILKENALLDIKHQLSGCNDKIKSLEETEVAIQTEKKELESSILSLRAHVKLMEETKEEILRENSHYKSQALDSGSKFSFLEIKLEELERNVTNLTEELSTKNSLVKKMEEMVKDCQGEVESMKEGQKSSKEAIVLHEKANSDLKQKIFKMEGTINSLEDTEKVLMAEKKELLCLVDEQRKTLDVLQQNLDSLNEQKILLENELSRWKAQSEAFEEMLEDIKIQGSVEKVELVDNDDAVKCKIVSSGIENEPEHATLSENASSELVAIGNNLKDAIAQTSCEYKDKNGIFNGDLESFSAESVGCLLDRSGDEEKLRQLDVGKLMQLINSWHDIDTTLEKLRVVEHLLKAKICSLWESVPRIQSKLKGNLNAVGSPQISMKEADQAKEVIMRIISMVRSLEKCNSSLEKELVHASSNAVSWGLQGIQNQFSVVTSTPNTVLTNDECNLEGEQKNVFCSFLDTLRDKVSQVLEDVNSSVEIFKEVEHRSANVAEALEYLKKNCLYEKELLSDVDYEGFQVALTEEESRERFIKAMDEMERAKEDLERIAHESRKEVESLQSEKENLEQELQSMTARCNVLESKLEMSKKHVELAVRETQQRVQKIFEKKLEATKEKWKSLYMDDLKKYEEECKLRKQFEESFKKYRSLAEDYEKRLAEATAQSADLKSKVQNLQHQKSFLEMKLRESSARNFMEDEHRESLDSGACKSNFTDVMANYFASKNISSPSHSTCDSHRDTNQDSISRSFSRESVQSSLPSGMGQVFCAEDEEGEWFNATYLNDLNEGKCIMPSSRASNAESCFGVLRESNKQRIRNPTNEDTPNGRMKELMRRNTLCLPHLKSSYPTETQFNDPKNFSEDLLKGSEQASEQGKIPSTPGRFRSWFARGKKTVPNSDVENVPFTPRTKQKG